MQRLRVDSLACRRGGRLVFRELGFGVEAGGLLLVVGENGGGKSSLLRVLAGLLEPESGTVLWDGADMAQDSTARRRCVAYVGHLDGLKPELTVGGMVSYWAALGGKAAALGGGVSVLEAFSLSGLQDQPVRLLSAGQRRRLALTRLLLSASPLWLLDEPLTALDARSQARFCELVARQRADGGVVVMASHQGLELEGARILRVGREAASC